MTTDPVQPVQVALEQLDDSMSILAYTGFSGKYKAMDDPTCKWLKHNFKGVKTIVQRGGERLTTPVESIAEGDRLLQLYPKFPPKVG
jgi:hypothetical protein